MVIIFIMLMVVVMMAMMVTPPLRCCRVYTALVTLAKFAPMEDRNPYLPNRLTLASSLA